MCHIIPYCLGGFSDVDNMVLGSADCNKQHTGETVESFMLRISFTQAVKAQLNENGFLKDHLDVLRKELMTTNKQKTCKDVVKRVLARYKWLKSHPKPPSRF
jgi:hypothetical protein